MGGFLFGPLESGAGGAGLAPVGHIDADGKNLGVLGTIAVLKRIHGKPLADALRGLLQLRLEILAPYLRGVLGPEIVYSRSTTARAFSIPPSTNTPPKTASIASESRVSAPTPALILLATGKTQAIVKMQLARNDRQRGLVDEAGTQTRQLAFPGIGETGEQLG